MTDHNSFCFFDLYIIVRVASHSFFFLHSPTPSLPLTPTPILTPLPPSLPLLPSLPLTPSPSHLLGHITVVGPNAESVQKARELLELFTENHELKVHQIDYLSRDYGMLGKSQCISSHSFLCLLM